MLNKNDIKFYQVTLILVFLVQIITGITVLVPINTAFPISPLDGCMANAFIEMTVQVIEFVFTSHG
jgi:hypothetical protein